MQEREISAIHGCCTGKFLLSIDAGKGNFCYPLMQQREVSAIHGCSKEKFFLSMDASKGSFCYQLMQERVISVIHGCSKGKFLRSIDAEKGTFCYPWTQRGFMGTIAYDYSRSIAEHSVNRLRSPAIYRSVSSGYVHLAEHDGWHCRRRFAKVVLSSFARLE